MAKSERLVIRLHDRQSLARNHNRAPFPRRPERRLGLVKPIGKPRCLRPMGGRVGRIDAGMARAAHQGALSEFNAGVRAPAA